MKGALLTFKRKTARSHILMSLQFTALWLITFVSPFRATAQSPGGISSNLQLWLKANVGISQSSGNILSWTDQSGSANNATIINGTNPTFINSSINSYPVANFSGAGGLQGAFSTAITTSNISAFMVVQAASATANPSGIFSIVAASPTNDGTNANSAILFQRTGSAIMTTRNNTSLGNYNAAAALGQYHLYSTQFSATQDLFYSEGKNATNVNYTAAAFNGTRYALGSKLSGTASAYLTGQIAEVILYNKLVSAAEKSQIESYLAIKYGLTLDQSSAQNYISSAGTVVWNGTTNSGYKNNIFGVGIDTGSGLSQTSSVSINTGLLSISNASSLASGSFLIVGDNGGSLVSTVAAGLPYGINEKIGKVWRASQTGTRSTARYNFDISTISHTGYFSAISSAMTPYLLIDSDANGIYENYVAANSIAGTIYSFPYDLPNGAQFTLGFKAPPIDYGDAWGVATTIANNGAGHVISAGVKLGSLIDAENNGQPSVNAVGDDTIGLPDDDGVNFNIGFPTNGLNILQIGINNTIQVTASAAGYINAWIDYDRSNTYDNNSEYAIIKVAVVAGSNVITFHVPDSIDYGSVSMRVRYAQNIGDVTGPTGLATNGEVEDYLVYIAAPLVGPCTNGFQNQSFESGPAPGSYIITSQSNLPYWRTTAPDKMIEVWKSGFNGVPAYNGTYFVELEANLYGALYQDVYTTPGTTVLWNFAHRGRSGNDTCNLKIGSPSNPIVQTTVIDGTSGWGIHTGAYIVPANQFITRFAFNAIGSYGGNQSIGNFIDDMYVANSFDFGDAPNSYGTLKASNGPYHAMTGTLYLGSGETCDIDAIPSTTATSDSLDDGISFPSPCAGCNTYTVNVTVYNNSGKAATLAGWVDFNKNGIFDAAERSSISIPVSAAVQHLTLTFNVSAYSSASLGSFARFRLANDSTEVLLPTGLATSGEVEDYQILCVALPLPIPTSSGPACTRGPLSLYAAGSAPYYKWVGPNGYLSTTQNPLRSGVQQSDSGSYRLYAVYANGCVTDSAVNVIVNDCYVTLSGLIFNDANADGIINGTDVATTLGKTVYAILADSNNTVLGKASIASNGTYTMSNVPAYMGGMTITSSTVNYSLAATSSGPQWPAGWLGTLGQYGTNNSAGTGRYTNNNQKVQVSTLLSNITGVQLGFNRLPTSVSQSYMIGYPTHNAVKTLTAGSGLGTLAGSDPEDGTIGIGQTFTITNVSGLNGNSLYYSSFLITNYTTITNFNPSLLSIKFTGAGSTSASFQYGATDASGQTDPAPATYSINWPGALPVSMLYFSAQKKDQSMSLIRWATASEIDNSHFDLQRSSDAQHWEKIATLDGHGTTSEQNDYSYIDDMPKAGLNYYRLQQIDNDGHFQYSDIAEVQFTTSENIEMSILLFPNPLSNSASLQIALSDPDQTIDQVIISNIMGQIIYSKALSAKPNQNLSDFKPEEGIYFVTIRTSGNKVLTTRLLSQ